MMPDDPKEYITSSLKNLLELVEQDKISLSSIQDDPIIFPNVGRKRFVRGRRITLELHYAD